MPEEPNTPQVTEETGGKITIDPHQLDHGVWEELWNVAPDDVQELSSETWEDAESFDVTIDQAESIAHNCREKAAELRGGDRDDKKQALDLESALEYLEGLLPEPEANTNCLEGMNCPSCGSLGPFTIAMLVDVTVYDSGTEEEGGDREWGLENACHCNADECDFMGTVRDFTIEERGKPEPPPFMTVARIFDNTEWALLREQKRALCEASTMPDELREGLLAFLDHIQDRAQEAGYPAHPVQEEEEPFRCTGCGRPEDECSADPCPGVIADRES